MTVRSTAARALAVLAVGVGLSLQGCGEKPQPPASLPSSSVTDNAGGSSPMPSAVSAASAAASTSVPDAAAVLGTRNEPKVEPPPGRTTNSMSRTEESTAMPLPGQNNDHSVPIASAPAPRASSPK